jgi:hypothetical protein
MHCLPTQWKHVHGWSTHSSSEQQDASVTSKARGSWLHCRRYSFTQVYLILDSKLSTSETSVSFYQTTRRNITEDSQASSLYLFSKFLFSPSSTYISCVQLQFISNLYFSSSTCPLSFNFFYIYGPVHVCLSVCRVFHTPVTAGTMTSEHISARMTQDATMISDHISSTMIYVMWREEHLWNVSVLWRTPLECQCALKNTFGMSVCSEEHLWNVSVLWRILLECQCALKNTFGMSVCSEEHLWNVSVLWRIPLECQCALKNTPSQSCFLFY